LIPLPHPHPTNPNPKPETAPRWAIKDDGHRDPSARTLLKPALNLFHGERGSKRWKNAMDAALKVAPKDATVRDLLAATLGWLPPSVLDAPPLPAAVVAGIAAAGGKARPTLGVAAAAGADAVDAAAGDASQSAAAAQGAEEAPSPPGSPTAAEAGRGSAWAAPADLPAPEYALKGRLPVPEDRAAGDDELRRKRIKEERRAARAAALANGGGGGDGCGDADAAGERAGGDQQQRQQQAEEVAAQQQAVTA
jgi:hypothetical protein